jgi:hypothetical protein
MRFKANTHDFIRPDQSLFYNFGLNKVSKTKLSLLSPYNYENTISHNSDTSRNLLTYGGINIGSWELSPATTTDFTSTLKTAVFVPLLLILDFISTLPQLMWQLIQTAIYPPTHNLMFTNLTQISLRNYIYANLPIFTYTPSFISSGAQNEFTTPLELNTEVSYLTNNYTYLSLGEKLPFFFSESADTYRFTKFHNPLINYDYKCGHYLTIWDQLYHQLATSLIEVSRGIRKAP